MRPVAVVVACALCAVAGYANAQSCPPSPAGIVGWWTGDENTKDVANGNDATNDGAAYSPGVVNEQFQLDGSTSTVVVGNPAVLQLQTFSIVMWITRADATVAGNANLPSANTGELFCYGAGGYCLGLEGNGTLFLSKVGTSEVESTGAKITDTTPHLVAVTADSATGDVVFYVDAVASPTASYNPGYNFSTNVAIGVVGDLLPSGAAGNFFGGIDEVQVYDNALDASQILSIFNAGNLGTCRIIPELMAVDANAVTGTNSNVNGVFEAGETVQISPGWMNEFPQGQGLTGTASSLTGPVGPTYTIDDDKATYGDIPSGGQHDCNSATSNCFLMTISGTRPAQHWDATFQEALSGTNPSRPFANNWRLHVGESFPDVTTSHPFYVFVENLFHNGVTGGCAGGNFCPSDPVTRGQMAVFLLKGEHGGAYTPPACSATMFADVPCPDGQFVDWINQLATEGITGGCGGGNYCPGSSVTRGQMAVFLLKGEHGGAYAPPVCSATMFNDVECPNAQFVDWINQLATEGITGGCGGGNYCPLDPVQRGQMAVFLTKTFGLILYGP